MGLASGRAQLQAAFPEGIALEAGIVNPSVLDQLEAGIEEAMGSGGWVDALTLAPSLLVASEVAQLLSRCPSLANSTGTC